MSDGDGRLREALVTALTAVSGSEVSARMAGRVLEHWDEHVDLLDAMAAEKEQLEEKVKRKMRLCAQYRRIADALARENGWTELQLERALELLPARERKSFQEEWGA